MVLISPSKEHTAGPAILWRSVMQVTPINRRSPCRAGPHGRAGGGLPPGRMIAAGILGALLLTGCSSGSSASTGSTSSTAGVGGVAPTRTDAEINAGSQDQSVAGAPSGPADVANPAAPEVGVAKPAAPVAGVAPKLTKSASLDLEVPNIKAAATQVRSIAAGLHALVLSEQIGKAGPRNPETPQPVKGGDEPIGGLGTLILSVPADKLDTALDQLGSSKIGKVLGRNMSSQDVTSQYVDTESRLKTMRASVQRVRALMAQAKDIGQVVALESEMSQREADLESLGSQLEALKTNVDRSTLTVSLSTPAPRTEAVAPESDNDGFPAGLRSGWDAFTTSAQGLFTIVGAVLPFAAFFALVSAPLWFWWRRRQANRPLGVATSAGLRGQPAPVAPAGP